MNYLDLIERIARIYRHPSRNKVLEKYSIISQRVTSYLSSMEGLLYLKKGGRRNAELSRRYLLILSGEDINKYCRTGFGVHAAALAYSCIKDSGLLSREDCEKISNRLIQSALNNRKRFLSAPQPRISNIPLLGMVGSEMVVQLLPEREESKLLKSYADEVWNDWWAIRDNPEVSSCYEPVTQTSLIRFVELRRLEEEYFPDSITNAAFERYLQHLSPLGVMTKYGDSGWADSWGFWAAVFEKAASYYRDGRFKWAARRILDYACRQKFWENAYRSERDDISLEAKHGLDASVLYETYGLVLASLWEGHEIPEQMPSHPSTITHRYLLSDGPPFTTGERVEEKLVLRSGWKRNDIFMMVGLLKKMWHHQYDAGAILLLSCKGSVLLQDTGYFWNEPRFHNGLLVRAEGEDFLSPQKSLSDKSFASVEFLLEHSRVSFARIRSSDHQGYPVDHTRTIVLGKESHVVGIWDVTEIKDGRWQLGPIYQAQKVVSRGEGYFDTTHEFMHGTEGNYWRNSPYNLLISFPLRTGEVCKATPQLREGYWDGWHEPYWVPLYMEGRTQHECLYQMARVSKGEKRAFLTLLIPHPSREDTANIVKNIRLLFSDELSCCIKIGSVTLLCNNGPQLSNDFITTDGALVYIEEKKGRRYIAFHGAKSIVLEGETVLSKAKKSDGELVFTSERRCKRSRFQVPGSQLKKK